MISPSRWRSAPANGARRAVNAHHNTPRPKTRLTPGQLLACAPDMEPNASQIRIEAMLRSPAASRGRSELCALRSHHVARQLRRNAKERPHGAKGKLTMVTCKHIAPVTRRRKLPRTTLRNLWQWSVAHYCGERHQTGKSPLDVASARHASRSSRMRTELWVYIQTHTLWHDASGPLNIETNQLATDAIQAVTPC